MPIYTDTLPQNIDTPKTTTLKDLVNCLPEKINYPLNVWISGKIARYGITTDNLIFLIEYDEEPPSELKLYFDSLVKPLGIDATVSNSWKNNSLITVRLYNEGNLIIDKEKMMYKELPSQVRNIPILTAEELKSKLPNKIQWNCTLWLTGGIVKNGWSANDTDIIIFEEQPTEVYNEMRHYFTSLLGWRVDVGRKVMLEREPVYLFKLYEGGSLCRLQH